MDTKYEDNMVRQIESNLNNSNENLFQNGRAENQLIPRSDSKLVHLDNRKDNTNELVEYPLVSNDPIGNSGMITRAEYIRQAREACLRQLSNVQIYTRPYDVNYMEPDEADEPFSVKKNKAMNMFHNETEDQTTGLKNTQQQLASYRSLVIRCVCAIVLFLSVFAFDKFNVKIGQVTNKVVQEYVTGNDALKDLEQIIVSWIK
jgi:hypothetical protein